MDFIKPKRISEANIQAECYSILKSLSIECYLEYKAPKSRFDMVIIKYDKIVAIVEFKSRKLENVHKERKSKQLEKYKGFGVPVLTCFHMTQIKNTVNEIVDILAKIP